MRSIHASVLLILHAALAVAQEEVPIRGRLVPERIGISPALIEGRVAEVAVRPGDRVEAGQVLVRLEAPDVESRVRTAELDLQIAELEGSINEVRIRMVERDLEGGRHELAIAERQVDEARRLVEQGTITPLQLEQGDMALAQMRGKLAEGEATLEARKIEIQASRTNLERVRIELERRRGELAGLAVVAPIAGTVSELGAIQGEWLERGREVARIEDGLAFAGEVDQIHLPRLVPGAEIEVRVPGSPRIRLGMIERVLPGKEGMLRVEARLAPTEGPPDALAPGLIAEARLAD